MRVNFIITVASLFCLFTCSSVPAAGQTPSDRGGKATRAGVAPVAPAGNPMLPPLVPGHKDGDALRGAGLAAKDNRPDSAEGERDAAASFDKNAPELNAQPSPSPTPGTAEGAHGEGAGDGSQVASASAQKISCQKTIEADIVALDYAFYYNRYGAFNPGGMIYALRRDVIPEDWAGNGPAPNPQNLEQGKVQLRRGKRARPLVLRVNAGDCLRIKFQNLLSPGPKCNPSDRNCDQPHTRTASAHVQGLQLVNSILDDGSNVGRNPSSLVPPGGRATYTYYAQREGGHLLYSAAAMTGGQGNGGSLAFGLFGSVNVEPRNSEWYRSQLTEEEMRLATVKRDEQTGHPLIDYKSRYPKGDLRGDLPILSILDGDQIVHADLNAVITYKDLGQFPVCTVAQANSNQCPPDSYRPVAVSPNRHEPFREFTVIYHDEIKAVQAFPQMEDDERNPNRYLAHTLHSVRDAFAINYGTGGIGAEILANRFGVGPVHRCDECLYEEFFLSSWAVGDPAMLVDVPANRRDAGGNLIPGPKATMALHPEDPSNVHHSYLNDHVKFRVMHAGPKEHHIHHLHAHQWLHTPDSDTSTMLDSQAIGPGSSFNTELVHGGAGNRSKTPGDSIFHCHFYPHFAQGMWELMRVHDVFEEGTKLDPLSRRPVPGSRALPDGEIAAGTPIPALVPIPTIAMAPMPGYAHVRNGQVELGGRCLGNKINGIPVEGRCADGREYHGKVINDRFFITAELENPGYPFFVPSEAGHRPPRPPLDTVHDGGLPRHIILADPGNEVRHHEERRRQFSLERARLDFDKMLLKVRARELPEDGTPAEKEAMEFHATPRHRSITPEGRPQDFIVNGLPSKPGAPYSDPCRRDDGTPVVTPFEEREAQQDFEADRPHTPDKLRVYKAAIFQMDVIFNKAGWHFPQQRISTLWHDVVPTLNGQRAPEPLFIRANSDDCALHYLTNLVPRVYKLDDFQVRTPTDIMGQHVHLVKFDVTSSDGGGNGFNYEDGSLSPDEVRERIHAINEFGGLEPYGGSGPPKRLEEQYHPFSQFRRPEWKGAQTTVQRWFVDRVLDNAGNDRTQRTAFTHDHFGPSTHQQVGQYAGVAVEPQGSKWRKPFFQPEDEDGIFGGHQVRPQFSDGGPTSWRADILSTDPKTGLPGLSYREFLLEFTDFQHAYKAGRGGTAANPVPDHEGAINPPAKEEERQNPPFLLVKKRNRCPNTNLPPPCPEAVAAADVGTMVINYRNEPIPHRIWNFNGVGPDPGPRDAPPRQAPGDAGDLAHVYRSDIPRVDRRYNTQPCFYPPLTGMPRDLKDKCKPFPGNPFAPQPRDPFTPLLTAYEDDPVQLRILVGAHEEGHNFTVNGIKWLMEPSFPNSGYRNSQMMGISEHFEFVVPGLPVPSDPRFTKDASKDWLTFDFRYAPGAAVDDQWNGLWGLLRTSRYIGKDKEFFSRGSADNPILQPLPSNPDARAAGNPAERVRPENFRNTREAAEEAERLAVCPDDAPRREYDVTAVLARDALSGHPLHRGTLVYNPRQNHKRGRLHDPTAVLFVQTKDLHSTTKRLLPGREVEPLVLRAAAHDCVKVTLRNEIRLRPRRRMPDRRGFNTLPMIIDNFNANQIRPSSSVGLHPQLVYYNIRSSDGMNIGRNPEEHGTPGRPRLQTVRPGDPPVVYYWYAGGVITENERKRLERTGSKLLIEGMREAAAGQWEHRAMEFGATNLMPADPIKHSNKGAIGALVIEPQGSTWPEAGLIPNPDPTAAIKTLRTQTQLTVKRSDDTSFREFVLLFQNDLNLRDGGGRAVENTAEAEDAEDSGQKALNYRTEPFWKRMFFLPCTPLSSRGQEDDDCRRTPVCDPTRTCNFTRALSNEQMNLVGGVSRFKDPVTPLFRAPADTHVRFRVLHPGGHARNNSFVLHGHTWEEQPYTDDSTRIGHNPLTEWKPSQVGHGPSNHFDVDLLIGAGGHFNVVGDYLYRDQSSFGFDGGLWGVFRVGPDAPGINVGLTGEGQRKTSPARRTRRRPVAPRRRRTAP